MLLIKTLAFVTFQLPSPSSDLKVPYAATCDHRFLILVSDGGLFKLNVVVLDPSRIRLRSLTNQLLSIDSLAHKCCLFSGSWCGAWGYQNFHAVL